MCIRDSTVVRHEHFVAEPRIVVVTEDPVDHVATVARAGRADAIAIDERIATQHISDTVRQIDEDFAAPIAANIIHKLLAVTGRAARVRCKYDIARVREYLRVPAIAPVIVPCALWSTVNQYH